MNDSAPSSNQSALLPKIPFPNNMGVVRYVLAFAVFLGHFSELTGNMIWFPIHGYEAVGGFFALSGFLIYASFRKRPTVRSYIVARARRILPAYILTVIGAALLLSLVTKLPVGCYFLSSGFWKYLGANLTFLNFLAPTLPGVFEGMTIEAVNGSLWTMKVEWALYLSVPLLFGLIGQRSRHPLFWVIGVILFSITYRLVFNYLYESTGQPIFEILGRQFMGQFAYFYTGALCYLLLPRFLRFKWWILAISVGATFCGPLIPYFYLVVQPLSVSVLVIWISIVGRWGTWEGKRDNISYNIYLCHYPIIQTYVWLRSGLSVWFGLGVCCIAVIIFAYVLLIGEKYVRKKVSRRSY